jgi:hypothetical protein
MSSRTIQVKVAGGRMYAHFMIKTKYFEPGILNIDLQEHSTSAVKRPRWRNTELPKTNINILEIKPLSYHLLPKGSGRSGRYTLMWLDRKEHSAGAAKRPRWKKMELPDILDVIP